MTIYSRLAAVILGAVLVPLLILGLVDNRAQEAAAFMFLVILGHALFLGLPAAILLWRFGRTNVVTAALAGFTIGSLPMLVYSLLQAVGAVPLLDAVNEGVALILDGSLTSAGWAELARDTALAGLLGVSGGLAAWTVWHRSEPSR